MSTMQDSNSAFVPVRSAIPCRRSAWDVWELVVGYSLILLVIWTPRPEQRWFYWSAIVWFAVSLYVSYPGRKELGFHTAGFCRSLWVVGVAMVMAAAAIMLASSLHTLHHPNGLLPWVMTFGGYAVWSFLQQFLMQGYFLLRLVRVLPQPDLGSHHGRHYLCDRAFAQPDSYPDHAYLGPGRLLRLSAIPQHFCARHGACHLWHLRRHHYPRAGGSQHACRAWLSPLSGSAACSPEPKRP